MSKIAAFIGLQPFTLAIFHRKIHVYLWSFAFPCHFWPILATRL